MFRAGVAIALIAILAVFAAVQTYRVHELRQKLASVALSPVRAVGTELPVANPVREQHPAAEVPKPEAPQEADAAAKAEAMLKRERERVQEVMGKTSGSPASAASDGSRDAQGPPGPNPPVGKTAQQAGADPARKNAKKETKAKASQTNRVAESEVLTQAQQAVDRGSYDDAIALLKQGLQADPASRNLNVTLGSLYHRLRQYDAELQTYLNWSAQSPDEAFPHYQAAQTYATLGRSDEALQELSRFLDTTQQMTTGDMNVYPMVASVYRSLGMSADEGAVLKTWAQQSPNELNVHRSLADYYSRTGDSQAALSEYQGIAQQVPQDADAHRNLAWAYRRLDMNQEAESELIAATTLQPQNMATRLQLGDLYRQNQNYDAALQIYTNVAAAVPNTPEALQAQQMIAHVQAQIQALARPK